MLLWQVSSLSSTLALGATCLQLLKLCRALCHISSITQGLEGVDGLKAFSFTFPSRVESSFLCHTEITSNTSMGTIYTCTQLAWSRDHFQTPLWIIISMSCIIQHNAYGPYCTITHNQYRLYTTCTLYIHVLGVLVMYYIHMSTNGTKSCGMINIT